VTIDGDDLEVDFDGTSSQVDAGLNCPFGNIVTVTEYIVKCMLVPDLPNAEGFFRPIEVTAPEDRSSTAIGRRRRWRDTSPTRTRRTRSSARSVR